MAVLAVLSRRLSWWPAILATALSFLGGQASVQASVQDYQVKAVFLFNFTQFVDWPPGTFHDPQKPIVICVLGEDPFGTFLDDTVRGERVADRFLVVRHFHRVEDIDACQVLFISRSEAGRLDQIVAQLRGHSILTVSDVDSFDRQGGMIRFVAENDRIRLRINVDAARAVGLTISSKLLRVAEIISAGKTE